ncbi:1-hydroxycarotenoid 3,4-desaturase [Rhizobium sp. RU20A]|uniref:1-hydroxycarotenoid 3,4-desaturase CrtD n=1 Tax=Rhizobium sp. RU20A TaxID=1907412 RepID=UPI000955B14B|nr:1-hydroxycarotenoid 3,4-desaturase CrtD [Rhizobium sp. RU20A]SIR42616.1 1-hydroxycarotenoid 3,4-desaturase [Rhizobium sp. RU20A]
MPEGPDETVVVIGAGMGGLAAAIRLAAAGLRVSIVEARQSPGGKLRQVPAGPAWLDAGPTVLTMRWVFDDLLSVCGTSLADEISLTRATTLARHVWRGGQSLDLFADVAESRRAIADFAGRREGEGFSRFAADSARIFTLLKDTFIDATRPNPLSLSARIGLMRPGALLALRPFSTLWSALSTYFADERLRQLFGRYATYCGSSPFDAPATLMLVAHVEQAGVWIVEGGMQALALRLAEIAEGLGVTFHYGERVSAILKDSAGQSVAGVRCASGRVLPASEVIFNGDAAALPGLLGRPAARPPAPPSLSALVACTLTAPEPGPLAHHTVHFSDDYRGEFEAIFKRGEPPADPTVYLCAPDRTAAGARRADAAADTPERLYALMNMPANGDRHSYDESEIDRCLSAMESRLSANGSALRFDRSRMTVTAPDGYSRLFPATGGALYGMASHGWAASFRRPGARTGLKGLYLAGGSIHPGPGVPMAALSGKIAAASLMADRRSDGPSSRVAISGGMPMRSATAAPLP